MKTSRIALTLVLLAASVAVAQSDAKKSFDQLRALQGTWTGKNAAGNVLTVDFRDTAGGSALLNEIHGQGPENMVTMFNLDNDRLLMTHYCSAGNQPRMVASVSPDGKTFTFNFLDATNITPSQPGHMVKAVFTVVDANHHTEDWTFKAGDKEMHEHFDLQRSAGNS